MERRGSVLCSPALTEHALEAVQLDSIVCVRLLHGRLSRGVTEVLCALALRKELLCSSGELRSDERTPACNYLCMDLCEQEF